MLFRTISSLAILCAMAAPSLAEQKPNILVIFGDDVGYWTPSYNNDAMMGFRTHGSLVSSASSRPTLQP